MRVNRPVIVVVLFFFLALTVPAAAHGETFFVEKSGSGSECTQPAPCATISAALAASRAAPGTGDRIEVGPGLFAERVAIDKAEDDDLTLVGAGRGADQESTPAGATTLRAPEADKGGEVAIATASGVTVESLRVEVPNGFTNTPGLALEGPAATVGAVQVESGGASGSDAVFVNAPDAMIEDALVRQLGVARGIVIFEPRAKLFDSDVFTTESTTLDTEFSAEAIRVLRTRLRSDEGALATIRSPDVVIDSSLLTGGTLGVEVFSNSDTREATLSNDTIDLRQPKVLNKNAVAARARAEGSGTAAIRLVNSIAVEAQEVEGTATQSVRCESSIAPTQEEVGPKGRVECGPGGGNLAAAPSEVFVAGADWHLAVGSPAVDSGSAGVPLSETDFDGNPRIADGNRDGVAAIDRGAYELPTPPPPVPSTPPTPPSSAVVSPSNAFTFGKLKRNGHKGTAKLEVRVPGPGVVVLAGKKVKRATRDASGPVTVSLAIVAKPNLARALRSTGSVKTSVKVTFTPTGGTANTRAKTVKLVRTGG